MSERADDSIAGAGCVVEAPIFVDDADAIEWDMAADVVVIGFGGAGAAAALEAREHGADVLVLERFEGGGSTAYSGGVFYAGGGTPFQQAAGVEDTPENMFNYLRQEHQDAVGQETLRRFCEESRDNVGWLVKHGVRFEGSLYEGKTNYPPEDKYLYFAGNEKVPTFAARAKPAARGHRTKGKGWTGYAFFEGLRNSVIAHGARVLVHARAVRLVVDRRHAVVGVEVLQIMGEADRKKHQDLYSIVNPLRPFNTARAEKAIADALDLEKRVGVRKFVRSRDGLIMATGGFGYNLGMVREHMPFLAERNDALIRLGSAGCSGGGIQMGVSVGGSTSRLERAFLGRMIAPPDALVQGLIVNKKGERFINEDAYNASLGEAILQQPGGDAWIILDRALHRLLLKQCIPAGDGTFRPYLAPALLNLFFGGTKKSSSLAGLADKIGVPPVVLENTVATSNTAAARGQDLMGKNPHYVRALGRGPYRALNTSIGNKFSFCIFFTLGGLRVDELRGLVLRNDGSPIDGLYAAGRTATGIPSDGYISGLSLADCIFSGRRAGRDAALVRAQRRQAVRPLRR